MDVTREHLEQLLPPAPALDTATLATGLGDTAARESVARLLAQLTQRPAACPVAPAATRP